MSEPLNKKMAALRRESEEREAQRRAEELGLAYIDLAKAAVSLNALKFVSEAQAREARVAPLEERAKKMVLAVFDPRVKAATDLINNLEGEGFKVDLMVGSLSGLDYAWKNYAFMSQEAPQITGVITIDALQLSALRGFGGRLDLVAAEIQKFDFKMQKIEDLLEIILVAAIAARASDIHFEIEEKAVRIRFRIDGVLHDVVPDFSKEVYHYAVARIKLLSKMKINVEREPQDGRFTISLPDGKEDEVRVSVIPSEYGETVVLRVLFETALDLSLEDLGLRADDLAIVKEQLKEPNGMILNTGSTGSGKTTTLYVFLRAKSSPEIKIVTIEKPIEYHLAGIAQTEVREKEGYGFAEALKSILRQDPDVILVGEINDEKTAETAMQAALTGHLVFSTVHANNAPAAIPRLLDLGIKPDVIGPALNLIIAQRLVRKLCPDCKTLQKIDPGILAKFKKIVTGLPKRVAKIDVASAEIYRAKGCAKCGGLGYRGRIGIFELFSVDEKAEKVIFKDASESALRELAKEQGMVTMQEDGVLKMLAGVTSIEEVEGATGPIK